MLPEQDNKMISIKKIFKFYFLGKQSYNSNKKKIKLLCKFKIGCVNL